MAATPRGGYIVPNQRIPRMIGILNITFAAQLLIVGLCTSVYGRVAPVHVTKAMGALSKRVEQDAQAKKQIALDRLNEDEKAATTEDAEG